VDADRELAARGVVEFLERGCACVQARTYQACDDRKGNGDAGDTTFGGHQAERDLSSSTLGPQAVPDMELTADERRETILAGGRRESHEWSEMISRGFMERSRS
jgi:hypothetical protein